MRIAESSPGHLLDARVEEPSRVQRADGVTVVDTTELRWFLPGPLPPDIDAWFAGTTGVTETRCDAYLLSGRTDVGVKRRFQETLELKVRRSVDDPIALGERLVGSPEVWRKWSLGDGDADSPEQWRKWSLRAGIAAECVDGPWIDVHKSVVKRRFSIDGSEIVFSSDPHAIGAGCDVEVADVGVGPVRAWTFAFAAFGPPSTRRRALLAASNSLVAGRPCPPSLGTHSGRAMGYPEWLTLTVPPASRGRCERGDLAGRQL